ISKKEKVASTEKKLPRGKELKTVKEIAKKKKVGSTTGKLRLNWDTAEEVLEMYTPDQLLEFYTPQELVDTCSPNLLRQKFGMPKLLEMLAMCDETVMMKFPRRFIYRNIH
ncbi:hypothetical protein A2U01_0003948, partial [Trifolium medium]|nr:hypothetical protein [Trifolium medium]